MRPKIVLTHPLLPDVVRSQLAPRARVALARTRRALERELHDADGLIALLGDPIDEPLLARAPCLKVVGNFAVGVNNIDLAACARRGVRVVNTPHVLTEATAELTVALALAVARRIPEGEAICRANRYPGWTPDFLLGVGLQGRHAVLVGRGRIGREVARILRALRMTVEFITPRDSESAIRRKLARARLLSLHLPLTTATEHWLGSARIACLPRDAIVINTSRGPVVDERALARALERDRILGAGLDVYEREPDVPARLRRLRNTVLLPHVGSATHETREAMARLVIAGVLGILNGKRPWNEVALRRLR